MNHFDRRNAEAVQDAMRRDLYNLRAPMMPTQFDEDLAVDHPTYGFKLRRKRANKLIASMLREGGYEDLARMTNVAREE